MQNTRISRAPEQAGAQPQQPPQMGDDRPAHGSGAPARGQPEPTPTHQAIARTDPPRRAAPLAAALGITLVFGIAGAWLWASMGPVPGIVALAVGAVLLLALAPALRGSSRARGGRAEV